MKGYYKYFSKKLLWYLVTLVIAIFLNFMLPRLIPGNPVDSIMSKMGSISDTNTYAKIYASFAETFGTDKPMIEQFGIYVGNLFSGDLGISFNSYPRPVADIIAGAVPWTLILQIPAILIGWLLGNLLGAMAAYRKGIWDKAIFPTFLFLNAVPPFAMAMVLVWIFAHNLGWFPAALGYSFDMVLDWSSLAFWGSVLQHFWLPFISIIIVMIGGQSLGMREMSLYELNADYVKYSRLMGIKDGKIVTYVFRNAMLPQITGLALSLGTMVGGALITEIVFSYPGLGTTLFTSLGALDYPMISGCTLIISVTVLVANFAVDVICGLIDPRVKAAQSEEG